MHLLQQLLLDESEFAAQNLEMYHKAYADFIHKKIQGVMNIAFENGDINPLCDNILSARQSQTKTRAKNMGTLYLWLTISPDEKKTTLEKFVSKLHQVSQRKMIKEFYYVIEQRGKEENEIGKGYHAHMLLERSIDYRQDKFIKNLKNSFKTMTNTEDFHLFNFYFIPDEFYDDKIEYMLGTKTGEEKDLKQKIDVLFRQKYNLSTYYTNASTEKTSN